MWVCVCHKQVYIDGLVQDCSNSIVNPLELLQYVLSHGYNKYLISKFLIYSQGSNYLSLP